MRERWELSILQCINSLGGRSCLKGIYDKISDFVELTEDHRKEEYGRPAYHNQIRSHITNLCQSGEITKISRGCYSLTEKGQKKVSKDERNV